MLKRSLVLIAVLIATVSTVGAVHAQASPAPELFQEHGACYRSIVETDDLFCLSRYELPVSLTESPVSPEAWCAELVNTTGCTDRDPEEPWSLEPGAANVSMVDGTTVLAQVQAPRIGNALGGLYFGPGHGITWGSTSINMCVESSASRYSTFEQACEPVLWTAAANNQTAQRAALSQDLITQLATIEAVDPFVTVNQFIANGLVTPLGRDLALEALSIMDRLLANTFQTEALGVGTDFTPSTGVTLQGDINATATAIVGAVQGLGDDFGVPSDMPGIVLFLIFGIVAFVFTRRVTQDGPQSMPLAAVAFMTAFMAGVPLGLVPVTVVAVAAVLISMIAAAFVVRKLVFA